MLKYLSLFSGIGAFESALTNLGVNYEVVNYCEIDKYASKSYSAIHGVPETKNLWDITKVNVFNLPKPGEIDLVTYGFPCQDISLAGKQKGLFFEALKVIEYCKPKVAIAENVKNLGISITSTSNPYYVDKSLKIRKLTPKECYRLMGFSDEEFERAEKFNSNTQLYKQAGNSIVVDVLEELFCMMLDEDGEFYL